MINLTTNITVAAAVTSGKKWAVAGHSDQDDANPPCLIVKVNIYDHVGGGQGTDIPWPTNPYVLYIYDAIPSQVLLENPGATDIRNQFRASHVQLAGTAYTTITNAMNLVTGKSNIRKEIESRLVAVGALPAGFAGT